LQTLGPDAAPAIPAIKDYIRRRPDGGTDLDSVGPTLLKLGPDGVKAIHELYADEKANRRAMIEAISSSRAY